MTIEPPTHNTHSARLMCLGTKPCGPRIPRGTALEDGDWFSSPGIWLALDTYISIAVGGVAYKLFPGFGLKTPSFRTHQATAISGGFETLKASSHSTPLVREAIISSVSLKRTWSWFSPLSRVPDGETAGFSWRSLSSRQFQGRLPAWAADFCHSSNTILASRKSAVSKPSVKSS